MGSDSKREFARDLQKINPRRLIGRASENTEEFFLSLGLIYNDLKDLIFFDVILNEIYRIPDANKLEISAHAGEFSGIRNHIFRLEISMTHEFLNFLRKNSQVFESLEFKDILSRLRKAQRDRWLEIQNVAMGESPSKAASEFVKFLLRVRNNFTFHYEDAGKTLRKGYVNFFFKGEKSEANEFAYYSLGENMRDTRFYFADAAVQQAVRQISEDDEAQSQNENLGAFIKSMNETIWPLMRAYIRSRPSA
ncbi:MAG TPA: hypothetical protein VMU25_00715 [Candidatus Paceibacterota bacterium]|nr:hypothetical protein [Candidatus Paceibacterota bacterium]